MRMELDMGASSVSLTPRDPGGILPLRSLHAISGPIDSPSKVNGLHEPTRRLNDVSPCK
jgi:hypothetical protein